MDIPLYLFNAFMLLYFWRVVEYIEEFLSIHVDVDISWLYKILYLETHSSWLTKFLSIILNDFQKKIYHRNCKIYFGNEFNSIKICWITWIFITCNETVSPFAYQVKCTKISDNVRNIWTIKIYKTLYSMQKNNNFVMF